MPDVMRLKWQCPRCKLRFIAAAEVTDPPQSCPHCLKEGMVEVARSQFGQPYVIHMRATGIMTDARIHPVETNSLQEPF